MDLLLIRHALPERVELREGRADPGLSPVGVDQAKLLGEWMSREHLDAVYSSPLRRAVETAHALADGRSLEVVIEPGVAEFDRDASSYVPFEEMARDSVEFQALMTGDWEAMGAPDPAPFRAAVVEATERIIDAHAGQRIAIVCHAGVINAYTAHVLGIDQPLFFGPGYTSINRVLAARSGVRQIFSLNEIAHLR